MAEEIVKRNHIFVKRRLQIKYALVILVSMLVTAVTVGADFYIRLYGFIGDFVKDLPDRNIDMLMANMNQLMYAKLLVLILIALAVSLYISHKFAGPIVHIEKSLDRLSAGDLGQKVYFRSGDELKHLAAKFNYALSEIRKTVSSDRSELHECGQELRLLKSKLIDQESQEKLDKVIERLDDLGAFWKL